MAETINRSACASLLAVTLLFCVGCSDGDGRSDRVAPDVTVDGFNLGGMDLHWAADLIDRAAGRVMIPPVDGRVSGDGHCIPGRWGLQLNTAELKRRVVLAPSGSRLLAAYELLPPTCPRECPNLPVREAAAGTRSVGLMVNVAWGEEHLPRILSILREQDARATFFVMGFWAEDHPELLQAAVRMGHEIGVHGYRDAHPRDMSPDALREDLQVSIAALGRLSGARPTLYTPHYGEVTDAITETAADLGLTTILWTADTADWMTDSVPRMLDRVLPETRDGAFILMHPTENTAAFLSEYLPRLKDMGLTARSCSGTLNRIPATAAGLDDLFRRMETPSE